MAVTCRLTLYLSPWNRLSCPTARSKRFRGAMRGGLWSSFSVPGAGILTRVDPYCDAGQGDRAEADSRGRTYAAAEQARLELLVGGQAAAGQIHRARWHRATRNRTRDQAAVVSPVEPDPRPAFPGLILQVGCLVELLIVVDAENSIPAADGAAPAPPTCGVKNRAATLEKTMSAENPWMFGTLTRPANPGILELCHSIGKVIGVAPENAEVVGVVRVLPDVLTREDQIPPERLLQARRGIRCASRAERGDAAMWRQPSSGLSTALPQPSAGEHQVLVERSFQDASVGSAKTVLVRLML